MPLQRSPICNVQTPVPTTTLALNVQIGVEQMIAELCTVLVTVLNTAEMLDEDGNNTRPWRAPTDSITALAIPPHIHRYNTLLPLSTPVTTRVILHAVTMACGAGNSAEHCRDS